MPESRFRHARINAGLPREIVAQETHADWSKRSAQHVHRKEIERHRRATQRGFDHILDR